eukprot:g11486.t1
MMCLPFYLMAAVHALVTGFPQLGWCYYQWAALLAVLVAVPLQLRSLHAVRRLALLSNLAVVAVLLMVVFSFLSEDQQRLHPAGPAGEAAGITAAGLTQARTRLWPRPGLSFLAGCGHVSSFVFAFQGQSIFPEVMHEMQNPRDFPKSLLIANGGISLVYLLSTTVCYYLKGDELHSFLLASMGSGPWTTAACLLLCFHVLVSLLLAQIPLTHKLVRMYWSAKVVETHAATVWFLTTATCLLAAYIIANAIPFFADFQNIIGAALGSPVMFGWPAFFYLQAGRLHKVEQPWHTRVGLVVAVEDLIRDWHTFGKPFDCLLVGYE